MQQDFFMALTGSAAAPGRYNCLSQQEQQPQRLTYITPPQGSLGTTADAAHPTAAALGVGVGLPASLNNHVPPPIPSLQHPCGVGLACGGGGSTTLYPPGPFTPWDSVAALNASVDVNAAQSVSTSNGVSLGGNCGYGGGADACTQPSTVSMATRVSAAPPVYASAQGAPTLARRISSTAPPHYDNNLPQLNSNGGHVQSPYSSTQFTAIMSAALHPSSSPYRGTMTSPTGTTTGAADTAPPVAQTAFSAVPYLTSQPLTCPLPPGTSVFIPSGDGGSTSSIGGDGVSGTCVPPGRDAGAGSGTSSLFWVVPPNSCGSGVGGSVGAPCFSAEMLASTAAAAPSGAAPHNAAPPYSCMNVDSAMYYNQIATGPSQRLAADVTHGGFAGAQPPQISPAAFMALPLGCSALPGCSNLNLMQQQQQQQSMQPPPAGPGVYCFLQTGQLGSAGVSPYGPLQTVSASPMHGQLVPSQGPSQLQQANLVATATTTAGTVNPTQYTSALPHMQAACFIHPSMQTGPVYREDMLEQCRSLIAASNSVANADAVARSNEKRLSASAKSKSSSFHASATATANAHKSSGGEGGPASGKGTAQAGGAAAAATAAVQGLPFDEDPVEIDTTKHQLIVNYLSQRVSDEQFKELFRQYGELQEDKCRIIYDFRHRKHVLVATATSPAAAAALGNGSSSEADGTSAVSPSSSAVTPFTPSRLASDYTCTSILSEQPTTTAVASETCIMSNLSVLMPTPASVRGQQRSKGYGFIYYKDGASTEAAIKELNGKEVDGKRIKVRYAEQQRHPDEDGVLVSAEAAAEEEEETGDVDTDKASGDVTDTAPARSRSTGSSLPSV